MINGELSEPFRISRGVRQGDALSCLLFDIAIEPLAENICCSQEIKGIGILGTRKRLKVKMFADNTTVILSEHDDIRNLQDILLKWCRVSGARFNIEKTEIIPLGNAAQRTEIIKTRKIGEHGDATPRNIHIARDGEPVRILGAWLGNNIDQTTTRAPIVKSVHKRLKRWSAMKHTLEGRRLILQMQVAGVTQYLTKVQGMPKEVENDLNKLVGQFMWNFEKVNTVNQAQMFAPHKKGGKKMLDIVARNKAIHLTWLKAYLNLGEDRVAWTYFADALIGMDIPESSKIDDDPGSRIMPILQTWELKLRNSSLPNNLKMMLRLAKEFNVQVSAPNPSPNTRLDLPIWYHVHSAPSVRKLYRTKVARCLRNKHDVKLVRDATNLLEATPENHEHRVGCTCQHCETMRRINKCSHPHECIRLTATLIEKINPKWNPYTANSTPTGPNPEGANEPMSERTTFDRNNETTHLNEAITIFKSSMREYGSATRTAPQNHAQQTQETTVYTDGACINNGDEDAAAGLGVWYGEEDERNLSMRVPIPQQSNQTGELMAVLMATKTHPPNEDLLIISDSKYVIDGLTKHAKLWESRNWIDTNHGDIFKCIIAWMRWRNGKTSLKWIKGHNGSRGNEEADRLAGEGAKLPPPPTPYELDHPPGLAAEGAKIMKLEQKDFYRILANERRIPIRAKADDNITKIRTCAKDSYGRSPTSEAVWKATRHKDLTRKTRDFLWKSTQGAYKIGEYWFPIAGYQERGVCPLCNEQEDMEHILKTCKAKPRVKAWELANVLWNRRYPTLLPTELGDILGCGLVNFMRDGKPDKGKNRLFRIIVSETAYLIWKMRNERRIRDNDGPDMTMEPEIRKRWTNAINRRLTINRTLTDERRFKKKAMDEKIVRATWSGCLKNEEYLPQSWPTNKGVLVGISLMCPGGHIR